MRRLPSVLITLLVLFVLACEETSKSNNEPTSTISLSELSLIGELPYGLEWDYCKAVPCSRGKLN